MTQRTGMSLAGAFTRLGFCAVLAGAAVLATACGGSTPNAASTPQATREPPAMHMVISSLACHLSPTSTSVAAHGLVGIRVRTVAHARMTAIYDESLLAGRHPTGLAGAGGRRTLWFQLTGAKPGSRVFVDVSVSRNNRTGGCHTSFVAG